MATLQQRQRVGREPRRLPASCPPIGFIPRFHQVGQGLYQSADGRARLRCPAPARLMLRIIDGARSELWMGLQAGALVFLRRSDGEVFRADVRWLPGNERFDWGRFEKLQSPVGEGRGAACRLRFSPRTHRFRSLDGGMSGRFNPENGRITQGLAGAVGFEGLVGNGFAALCFADGRSAVLGTDQDEGGNYLIYGMEPYLGAAVKD